MPTFLRFFVLAKQARWCKNHQYFFTLLMLLLTTERAGSTTTPIDDSYAPSSWYKKYDSYPEYCSTPEEMQKRRIPPLQDNPYLGETRLVHATVVVRHGARTPWAGPSELPCWDGYWDNPENVWDCSLTTILAPPNPNRVHEEEGDRRPNLDSANGNSMFLFEKKYDALQDPDDELNNNLGGTCQLGQLILRGYEQSLLNGKFLRDAYVYDAMNKFDHDERMRLIDTSFTEYSPWDDNHVRLRADDDQRTLMSGQVVLRGMLGPEVVKEFEQTGVYPTIPVHTADRDRDILDANYEVCPRLESIVSAAQQSREFQQFNTSSEAQELRKFMIESLGNTIELDCLMTTICTDRTLPDPINDYSSDDKGKSWFQRIAEYESKSYNLVVQHNDAEFAKYAMSPLWTEIMESIRPIFDGGRNEGIKPPKLALFGGHDTTIIPLLASIGPKLWNSTEWPPYASMMIIEIHEIVNDGQRNTEIFKTSHAFRLLFNGKVLTPLVEGCPADSDLCDAHLLTARVNPFSTGPLDCSVPETKTHEVLNDAATVLSSGTGILAFLGLVAISGVVGAILTFYVLTGGQPVGRRVGDMGRAEKMSDGFSDEPSGGFHD